MSAALCWRWGGFRSWSRLLPWRHLAEPEQVCQCFTLALVEWHTRRSRPPKHSARDATPVQQPCHEDLVVASHHNAVARHLNRLFVQRPSSTMHDINEITHVDQMRQENFRRNRWWQCQESLEEVLAQAQLGNLDRTLGSIDCRWNSRGVVTLPGVRQVRYVIVDNALWRGKYRLLYRNRGSGLHKLRAQIIHRAGVRAARRGQMAAGRVKLRRRSNGWRSRDRTRAHCDRPRRRRDERCVRRSSDGQRRYHDLLRRRRSHACRREHRTTCKQNMQ